jgi:hypothetical protein
MGAHAGSDGGMRINGSRVRSPGETIEEGSFVFLMLRKSALLREGSPSQDRPILL